MRKLITIQKNEKLNEVLAVDEKAFTGANHVYEIVNGENVLADIKFQKGARREKNSKEGIIDSDLLEIVRDRLQGFQEGEFSSELNAKALEHVELALMYLNRRIVDRIEKEILGKNIK